MKSSLSLFVVVPFMAAVTIAVSAQLGFPLPGTDIPQTAQTIAVLVTGSLLGPTRGSLAVVVYLLAGAVGLPVYSDGASGWATLSGSSAGYFAGFVLAATLSGALRRKVSKDALWSLSLQMLAAHGVILFAGCAWLALRLGLGDAFSVGVKPFIYGAVVKSAMCGLIVLAVAKFERRTKSRLRRSLNSTG